MFRAKRVVVSGDEKQMPPTNFFNARFENDEEQLDDDWLGDGQRRDGRGSTTSSHGGIE